MENLKKQLRIQQKFLGLLVLIALLVIFFEEKIMEILHVNPLQQTMEFQMGLLLGITLLCLLQIFKLGRVLSDESKLQLYYNNVHDERKASLRLKAGFPMVLITSSLMQCAGLVASFYNEVIFFTLVIASFVQLIICVFIKFYLIKNK